MPAKNRQEEKRTHIPAQRVFTDREEPRRAFWNTYKKACRNPEDYNVLSFYGRGGIGKSSLLKVLFEQIKSDGGFCVFYDMESGADMHRILTKLRNMLMASYPDRFSFDRFDLALLKFSQLAGERNELVEQEDKNIINSNRILSKVLDGFSILAGVSVVTSVIDMLAKGYQLVKEIGEERRQAILKKAIDIDRLQMGELLDKLPEFFSEDLSECCKQLDKPLVFFLDTYERLVNYMSDVGIPGQEDRWLRDTIIQYTPNSVWVIAGRDRLRWKEIDKNWENDQYFSDHILGQLGKADSIRFLQGAGITDETLCGQLFDLTDGDPLYLDLSVSTWQDLISAGKTPVIEDFGSQAELVERYLRYMDSAHKDMMELLSCFGKWTDDEIHEKAPQILGSFSANIYRTIIESTLVQNDASGGYYLHRVVKDAILNQMPQSDMQKILDKITELNQKKETLFSLDYVASLDRDVEQLIDGLKQQITVSVQTVRQKVDKLKKQSNYREICRVLAPLYEYEETVGFRDISVYYVLADYLAALTDMSLYRQHLEQTEKVYTAYSKADVPEKIWQYLTLIRINSYHNNDQDETALSLAQDLKAKLEQTEQTGEVYSEVLKMIGISLRGLNRLSESIQILEEVRQRQQNDASNGILDTSTLRFLSKNYKAIGEPEKALEMSSLAYQIACEKYGKDHIYTLRMMNEMALDYSYLGQEEKKEALLCRILDIYKNKYGYYNPDVLWTMSTLANIRRKQKRFQEALELDQTVYEKRKIIYGKEHSQVYMSLRALALDYGCLGDKDREKTMLEEALDGFHKTLGYYHPDSRFTLSDLITAYDSEAEYAKGEAICREGAELCRRNPDMAVALASNMSGFLEWLECYCRKQKKYAEAEQAGRELLAHLMKMQPEQQEKAAKIYCRLVHDLYYQEKYSEALGIDKEGLSYAEAHLGRSNKYIITLMEWTGYCCRKLGKYQEAYDADLACWELEKELYGVTDARTTKQKKNLDFDKKKLEKATVVRTEPAAQKPKTEQNAGKILRCWQGKQSSFVIETPSATLIFDWYTGKIPFINKNKPLYVFISHIHPDHYHPFMLSLANTYENVSVYMGYDYSDDKVNSDLNSLTEKASNSINFFNGKQKMNTDFGSLESLTSTDLGVAFLVKIDGLTLYHAGDLFPWGGIGLEFIKYTAPLKGVHIDYAMLPLDPRFPAEARGCIYHYLNLADISYFTPMHLWDKPDFVSAFAKENPQYCGKMIAQNPQGANIHQPIELLKPYTIQF